MPYVCDGLVGFWRLVVCGLVTLSTESLDIVFASDCEPCDACGEPVCPRCDVHYADCHCLGPDSLINLELEV